MEFCIWDFLLMQVCIPQMLVTHRFCERCIILYRLVYFNYIYSCTSTRYLTLVITWNV